MNFGASPEEAVHLRAQILSPVSPKPLRFPNPSSLPVLENQMDPTFNDTATYDISTKTAEEPPATLEVSEPASTSDDDMDNIYDDPNDAQETTNVQALAGSDSDHGMSVDSNSSGNADNQVSLPNSRTLPAGTVTDAPVQSHVDHVLAHEHASTSSHPADTVTDAPIHSHVDQVLAHEDAGPNSHSVDDLYIDDAGGNDTSVPAQTSPDAQQPAQGDTATSAKVPPNVQAVLDDLSAPATLWMEAFAAEAAPAQVPNSTADQIEQSVSTDETMAEPTPAAVLPVPSLPPAAASLPPRPPKQESPANYPLGSEILQYTHDHNTAAVRYTPHIATSLPPPGNIPPPQPTAGAPGTSQVSPGLPLPPSNSFQQYPSPALTQSQASPSTPTDYRQRDPIESVRAGDEDETPLDPETQQLFDAFLDEERVYESRSQWDKFPQGSRLFLGNLPSEIVTKRDIFAVFHKHGAIAQISIKKAYGFVQYLDTAACASAWKNDNGVLIRGRKINLEIANAQGSKRDKGLGDKGNRNRRSQSPDNRRGGGNKGDRYRGQDNSRQRTGARGRDDYRPGRSPSPRRNRDGYRVRSPDMYNGRRRSRSRSPYGFDGRQRGAGQTGFDDDCPLPRRDPRDVPDIQIIAKDNPDKSFIGYIEKAFEARGVRADVLILSSKLSEAAVVRRQILEGVFAVMKLDRMAQMTQRFNLSVFNRSAGNDNVRFDEYASQDLNVCIELVIRAKQTARPAGQQVNPAAAYAVSQYGIPIAQQVAPTPSQPPSLYGQLLPPQPQQQQSYSGLDSSALQQILGRVQQPPPPPSAYSAAQQSYNPQLQLPPGADLSRLLAAAANPAQQQQLQQNSALAGLAGNPAWASLLANAQRGNQQGQQGQGVAPQMGMHNGPAPGPAQSPVDMNNIMAQLARYGR